MTDGLPSDDFPIAEQIREAADDAARARLLLACPYAILLSRAADLKAACEAAGFAAGATYVEAVHVWGAARRSTETGTVPRTVSCAYSCAHSYLVDIVLE